MSITNLSSIGMNPYDYACSRKKMAGTKNFAQKTPGALEKKGTIIIWNIPKDFKSGKTDEEAWRHHRQQITFDYENNGITKKAMNVPAYKCPSCNKVIVPDLILGKLEAFAEWEKSNIIDYTKCEQMEAEIFTVVHNLLGA